MENTSIDPLRTPLLACFYAGPKFPINKRSGVHRACLGRACDCIATSPIYTAVTSLAVSKPGTSQDIFLCVSGVEAGKLDFRSSLLVVTHDVAASTRIGRLYTAAKVYPMNGTFHL